MVTALLIAVGMGASAFIALCAFLYLDQDRFIFHPAPNDPRLREQWMPHRVEIRSRGAVLEGWWTENPGASTPAVMIYFGGNAEDVLYTAASAARFDAQRVLVVNYRGYGTSEGIPSQSALFEDALAVYDYVVTSARVKPEQIVLMGRSLGSGVATMVASVRPVRAVVLVAAFDSLAAVAARHYRIFPVRWLLKHPFPSAEYARRVSVPALILAGENDFIIPAMHAQHLHEAWRGTSQLHVLSRVGHNDIDLHENFHPLINAFLERAFQGPQSPAPGFQRRAFPGTQPSAGG